MVNADLRRACILRALPPCIRTLHPPNVCAFLDGPSQIRIPSESRKYHSTSTSRYLDKSQMSTLKFENPSRASSCHTKYRPRLSQYSRSLIKERTSGSNASGVGRKFPLLHVHFSSSSCADSSLRSAIVRGSGSKLCYVGVRRLPTPHVETVHLSISNRIATETSYTAVKGKCEIWI